MKPVFPNRNMNMIRYCLVFETRSILTSGILAMARTAKIISVTTVIRALSVMTCESNGICMASITRHGHVRFTTMLERPEFCASDIMSFLRKSRPGRISMNIFISDVSIDVISIIPPWRQMCEPPDKTICIYKYILNCHLLQFRIVFLMFFSSAAYTFGGKCV